MVRPKKSDVFGKITLSGQTGNGRMEGGLSVVALRSIHVFRYQALYPKTFDFSLKSCDAIRDSPKFPAFQPNVRQRSLPVPAAPYRAESLICLRRRFDRFRENKVLLLRIARVGE